MRFITAAFLLSLISCDFSSVRKDTQLKPSSLNKIKLGNNPGNIIDGGLITSDNDRIYYVATKGSGLFSMKIDGTNIKKLSDDHVGYLNVLDGWLYYRKASSDKKPHDGGLYKMKTDGSHEHRLTMDEPFYINVAAGWIYYVNWSHSTDVCKIKTDGSQAQILYHGNYDLLTTDGNSLYFGKMTGPGTSILYSGSLDGKTVKPLMKDTIGIFFVYDDNIFYEKDFNKICRINKKTFKIDTLLFDDNLNANYIFPTKNSLYFGGVFGIQKFDLRKKKIEKLFSTRVIEFCVAAGYVYFTTATWDKSNERHTKTFLTKLTNLDNFEKKVDDRLNASQQ